MIILRTLNYISDVKLERAYSTPIQGAQQSIGSSTKASEQAEHFNPVKYVIFAETHQFFKESRADRSCRYNMRHPKDASIAK
jgi:hypothetical protein